MPDEVVNILNVSGDPISVVIGLLMNFWGELSESEAVLLIVDFVGSIHTEAPIFLSVLLIIAAFLLCRFPVGMSIPLGIAFSSLLGFSLTLAYFPPEGANGISPVVIASVVALVLALLYRLVSILSYFFAVGFFAYVSAYTGYILGLGKGDIFTSLIVSGAAIFLSLLLLPLVRTVGVSLVGGASASLAIGCVIDFSLLFGDAAPVCFFVVAILVALIGLRGHIKRRSRKASVTQDG